MILIAFCINKLITYFAHDSSKKMRKQNESALSVPCSHTLLPFFQHKILFPKTAVLITGEILCCCCISMGLRKEGRPSSVRSIVQIKAPFNYYFNSQGFSSPCTPWNTTLKLESWLKLLGSLSFYLKADI